MMESAQPPQMSKAEKIRQEQYQAESDLKTLVEASRIRSDKARSAAVEKMTQEQNAALAKDKGEG